MLRGIAPPREREDETPLSKFLIAKMNHLGRPILVITAKRNSCEMESKALEKSARRR
jgi:hypothetical protein